MTTTDNGDGDAGVRVLTERSLWTQITDYMTGWPYWVVAFERDTRGEHGAMEALAQRAIAATDDTRMLRKLHALRKILSYRAHPRLQFSGVLRCAARHGRLGMLKWLCEVMPHDADWEWEQDLLQAAIKTNDVDMLEWIVANSPAQSVYLSPDDASGTAGRGEIEVVRWLHEHGYRFSSSAMNQAAKQGFLAIVQYLHEHCTEGCTTKAMDSAAASGHLDVVQFLHTYRTEGCTKAAMDCAAEAGDLQVVKFLHENRSEGCSTSAMDLAAANGHLDVVQFLHENRLEGCTSEAIDYAAKMGHLDVVRFLHEHRSEGCSVLAMHYAAACGHLEILEFLHENRSEGCTSFTMEVAAANGHSEAVRFLEQNGQ